MALNISQFFYTDLYYFIFNELTKILPQLRSLCEKTTGDLTFLRNPSSQSTSWLKIKNGAQICLKVVFAKSAVVPEIPRGEIDCRVSFLLGQFLRHHWNIFGNKGPKEKEKLIWYGLKGQQREMVFWLKSSLMMQLERI